MDSGPRQTVSRINFKMNLLKKLFDLVCMFLFLSCFLFVCCCCLFVIKKIWGEGEYHTYNF